MFQCSFLLKPTFCFKILCEGKLEIGGEGMVSLPTQCFVNAIHISRIGAFIRKSFLTTEDKFKPQNTNPSIGFCLLLNILTLQIFCVAVYHFFFITLKKKMVQGQEIDYSGLVLFFCFQFWNQNLNGINANSRLSVTD